MIDYSERRTRVPGICPPRSAIAPAGDVLVMAPYLVIGAALWSIEALPTPRATNRSGLFLVWVSSWADPIRKLSRISAGTARTKLRRNHESVPVVYLRSGGSGP